MDSFSHRKDIDFLVLFYRYGITEKTIGILSQKYDTSYFGLLPEKYYPVRSPAGSAAIKVSTSRESIKALISDYNRAHQTKFTTGDIWVGVAFLKKGNSSYITKEPEVDELIKEINLFLQASD